MNILIPNLIQIVVNFVQQKLFHLKEQYLSKSAYQDKFVPFKISKLTTVTALKVKEMYPINGSTL